MVATIATPPIQCTSASRCTARARIKSSIIMLAKPNRRTVACQAVGALRLLLVARAKLFKDGKSNLRSLGLLSLPQVPRPRGDRTGYANVLPRHESILAHSGLASAAAGCTSSVWAFSSPKDNLCRLWVKPGLPPWGPHVRFRRCMWSRGLTRGRGEAGASFPRRPSALPRLLVHMR